MELNGGSRIDEAEFQALLRRNLIQNCPVTADDAKRELLIYGPDVATMKGKMTHNSASERVPTYEAVPIPPVFSSTTVTSRFALISSLFKGTHSSTLSPVPSVFERLPLYYLIGHKI